MNSYISQHLFCWSRYTFNLLSWTPPTYGFRLWIFKWLSRPTMETDSRGDLLCAGETAWCGYSVHHLQCRRSVFKWCKYFLKKYSKTGCLGFCAKCVRDGLYCGLHPDGCRQRSIALRDRSLILFHSSPKWIPNHLRISTAGHGARFWKKGLRNNPSHISKLKFL